MSDDDEPPQRVRRDHVLPDVPGRLVWIVEVQTFGSKGPRIANSTFLPSLRDLDAR